MEGKCTVHTYVKTLQPPIAFITLESACSSLSSEIKLPPYFRQYSKGFHIALKAADLHMPKITPTNFRIWTPFNLPNITPVEVENLRKVEPTPAIPIGQLRAQNASFRQVEPNKSKPWIYYVGGGSGSGLILLLVITGILKWRCKNPQSQETRSPTPVTYTAPENLNMMHTRVGVIKTEQNSAPGWETVGIQDPVYNQRKVLNGDMQYALVCSLSDQLEDLGADVKGHHRRLRSRQYTLVPQIEV